MWKCKTKSFRQIQAYSRTFRHIQAYSRIIQEYTGIFRTLCNIGLSPWCNPGIFRTLAYLETQHIQNKKHNQSPGIFRNKYNEFFFNAGLSSEAAVGGGLGKKLFLKLLQYSQKNMCAGVSSTRRHGIILKRDSKQLFSCQLCEIKKKKTILENICERLLL